MGKAQTERTIQRARKKFLEELAQCGNVSQAALKAKIGRTTAYEWKVADPEFAAAWSEALEIAADRLEAEAWRRAHDGYEEPVFGRIRKDQDGQIGTVHRYSDTLLVLLLKAHKPEKFRERRETRHVGLTPEQAAQMSDEELDQEIKRRGLL